MRLLRTLGLPIFVALAGALAVAWDGLLTPGFTDYEREAEPAFDLLRAGHIHAFLTHAPAYAGSMVLRAPFVAAVTLWHGGGDAAFRASAVPAILGSVVLAVMTWRRASGAAAWLALGLIAFNPLLIPSYEQGHPEELLVAVLCIAAVLAALADRPWIAGILAGAAAVGKPWAVVAIAPMVLALERGRIKALLAAGVSGSVILAPLILAGGQSVTAAGAVARATGGIFLPGQIWWFLGEHGHVIHGNNGVIHYGFRAEPAWLQSIAHPIVIAVCVGVSLVWWLRRRAVAARTDVLGLLTLVLLLRCLIDPWNVAYYELPFVLSLTVWEARIGRLPVAGLTASLLTWVTLDLSLSAWTPDVESALYLLWAVPAAVLLATRVFAPERYGQVARPVTDGLRRALPSLADLVLPDRPPASARTI